MLISLVLYICLPGLSCYAFPSYVHRGLSHRCFLICSVALFTWFFDFFFPEQFRTPCWVTTSFKWFKLLSTIQPDCNSQGGIDLGRLQLGNHWSLILLFCEQWKEGCKATFGAGRKTRRGHVDWPVKEMYFICHDVVPLIKNGCLKCCWEGFWGLKIILRFWVRVPSLISNVCHEHRMEERAIAQEHMPLLV